MVELERSGKEQEEHLQPPPKQQQLQLLLQPPAAPPRVWASKLVISPPETGSKSTASDQPQGQQQQVKTKKGQGMVVDASKTMVELETDEKELLNGLVVKLNYALYLSCSVRALAAESIDVGTRLGWAQGGRLRWRTLGFGGTDTQAENPSQSLHQTKATITSNVLMSGNRLDSRVIVYSRWLRCAVWKPSHDLSRYMILLTI